MLCAQHAHGHRSGWHAGCAACELAASAGMCAHGVRMSVCHLITIITHPIKSQGDRCLLPGQSWHRPLTQPRAVLVGSGEDCTYHSAHINKKILRCVCTVQRYTSACVYHANRMHATHSCNKTTPLASLCPSCHGSAYTRIKHHIPLSSAPVQ